MSKPSFARNDYFRALNLSRDPFSDSYSSDLYYITPELQHRLDLTRHLLEFSQQILLIKGVAKVGKTAICQHLIAHADDEWDVCEIDASGDISPDSLVKEILKGHRDMIETSSETISGLNNYLEYCSLNSRVPIVFIDNVDGLSQVNLRFIFQLMEFRKNETFIRIVLIGSGPFQGRLDEIAEQQSTSNLIHSISIPVFSSEQTVEYMRCRLNACDARTDMFSEKEMNRIHKVSAGIAGDINFLARQGLSDPANLINESPSAKLTRVNLKQAGQIFRLMVSAAFVAVILVVVTLFVQKDSDPAPKTMSLSLPAEQSHEQTQVREVKEDPEAEDLPDAWLESQVIQDPGHAASTFVTIESPETEVSLHESMPGPGRRTAPVINGPSDKDTEVTATDLELGEGKLRGNEWLLRQSPANYVLQLIGAVEIETISRFLQEAQLDASQLTLYKVKKSGKDWYVLVYGLYPELLQARAAVSSLSPRAQAEKPWPKDIARIQAAINGPGDSK